MVLADAGHMQAAFVFFIHPLRFRIHETIHGVFAARSGIPVIVFPRIAAHTGSPPGTSALTLVMTSERIASREASAALGTDMGSFSRVEFRMPFEVMEPSESRLTGLTHVRLLLAVGEEVTLEVMMSREFGGAVRTAVLLGRRRSRTALMEAGVRQTGPATRIIHTHGGHGVGKRLTRVLRELGMLIRDAHPIPVVRARLFDGTGTGDGGGVHQGRGRCRMTPGPKGVAHGAGTRVGIDLHVVGRDLQGPSHRVHRFTERVGRLRRVPCGRVQIRVDPNGGS
jgi:hypothetical protein